MEYIIQKDEMGIINYYNQNQELIMQDYNVLDDIIRLTYENNHIVKINNDNLTLELDFKGRLLNGFFVNGITCYFSYQHSKAVFLDVDGQYLGSLDISLETINGSNRIYLAKNLIQKLESCAVSLIDKHFNNDLNNINKQISKVNDLMVEDAVDILKQDNRRSCAKILNSYDEAELREKRNLLLLYKKKNFISKLLTRKDSYEEKCQQITRKYAKKRTQLKTNCDYANELKKLKAKETSFLFNQHRLNELLEEREALYLTRK